MLGSFFEWGSWTFDPAEWRLSHADSGPVSLPNRTLELLALLLDRAPSLVTKDEILTHVWRDSVVEEGNIAFHVAALRKALDSGGPSCIETVRGRGYRFTAPVARRVPQAVGASPTDSADLGRRQPAVSTLPKWSAVLLAGVVGAVTWAVGAQPRQAIHAVTVLPATLPQGVDDQVARVLAEQVATQIERRTTLVSTVGSAGTDMENAIDAGHRLEAESILTTRVDSSGASGDGPSGAQWRVVADLTRTRDARRLWSWMFTVSAEAPDVAGSQISTQIASGLGHHLGVARAADTARTAAPEAQALVLQARGLWRVRSPGEIQEAIRLYERAIAIDPDYAPAFAGLADAFNLTMSGLTSDVRYSRAKAAAERAVALDPDSAEGHTSLAFLRYKFEWRWTDADTEFARAIELNPNYALAHHWYGEFLGLMGRDDEAVVELQRALELEPESLAIKTDLVPPLLRAGRTADARAVVESAARINPNWHGVPLRLSEVLLAEGREAESLEQRWRWMVLSGASLESVGALQEAYTTGGSEAVMRVEVERWLAEEATAPGTPMVATNLSRHYARLGDRASALHWLETALDRREDAAVILLTSPDYDNLRGDPAFDRLLARVGLAPLPPAR